MTFNLPFPGQIYRANMWRFIPDPNGAALLKSMIGQRGVMDYVEKEVRVWMMPDGSWSRINLIPAVHYRRQWDGRYKKEKPFRGSIRITGQYPNYQTGSGVRVYIDGDGTFVETPCDFVERANARWRSVYNVRKDRPKGRGRYKKTITLNNTSGGYDWIVRHNRTRVVGQGNQLTRRWADIEAGRAIQLDMGAQ